MPNSFKKSVIESSLENLKNAHKNRDLAAIDAAMAEMNNAWQAASQDMYNATQELLRMVKLQLETQNNLNRMEMLQMLILKK